VRLTLLPNISPGCLFLDGIIFFRGVAYIWVLPTETVAYIWGGGLPVTEEWGSGEPPRFCGVDEEWSNASAAMWSAWPGGRSPTLRNFTKGHLDHVPVTCLAHGSPPGRRHKTGRGFVTEKTNQTKKTPSCTTHDLLIVILRKLICLFCILYMKV